MTAAGALFALVNAIALLVVPRRWAPAPLLIGALYVTLAQQFNLGPLHFPVIRILIGVGFIRAIVRGERPAWGINGLDWIMISFTIWACMTSFFHEDVRGAFVERLGLVYNAAGFYFLIRIFCSSTDDVLRLCRTMALLLVPLALEMCYEHLTSHNLFSLFAGSADAPFIRNGRLRALGPFAHPILAGTAGAACLPMMMCIWRKHVAIAFVGFAACVTIIVASSSSGPVLSAAVAIVGVASWQAKPVVRVFRWSALFLYLVLALMMKAPPYFLLARIDLVGGSDGYYRAQLIASAMAHINEWWLVGTDYTRHWMVTGVDWSANHVDITNYFLHMGVVGGLPLILLLVAILVKTFTYVGLRGRTTSGLPTNHDFVLWAFGAALFMHTVTFFSVTYFDQSFLFFYLTAAVIASLAFEESLASSPAAFAQGAVPVSRGRYRSGNAAVTPAGRASPSLGTARILRS